MTNEPMEDRIRNTGEHAIQQYVPSTDLDDRIRARARLRVRHRRQLTAAGLGAGVAALAIAAFAVGQQDDGAEVEPADTVPAVTTLPPAPTASTVTTYTPTTAAAVSSTTASSVSETTAPDTSTTGSNTVVEGEVIVRFDGDLPTATFEPIVELDVPIAPDEDDYVITTPSRTPLLSFDRSGSGTLLVVSPTTGEVLLVSPHGDVARDAIPADDPGGVIHDAAIGPDGVLYVSRVAPADPPGTPEPFTLVAYRLDGDGSGHAEEVVRAATTWDCVEGFCGNILFDEHGIVTDVAAGVVTPYADAVTTSLLGSVHREPQGATATDAPCVDDAGYGFFAPMRDRVTYGGVAWTLEVVCTHVAEGEFTTYRPQADGSVLAVVEPRERSSEEQVTQVLVQLSPDGAANAFRLDRGRMMQVALAEGRLLGVQRSDDGQYRLVEITPTT